jgi:hypothetical protein
MKLLHYNQLISGNLYYLQNNPYENYNGKQKGIFCNIEFITEDHIWCSFKDIINISNSGYPIGFRLLRIDLVKFYISSKYIIIHENLVKIASAKIIDEYTNTNIGSSYFL